MSYKKGLSLLLAAILLLSSFQAGSVNVFGSSVGKGMAVLGDEGGAEPNVELDTEDETESEMEDETESEADEDGVTGTDPGGTTVTDPSGTGTDPGDTTNAQVSGLGISYDGTKDTVVISYQVRNSSFVRIYVDGRVVEEQYTGTVYHYLEAEEGFTYEFRVEPYNARGQAGTSVTQTFSIPWQTAQLDDVDVDYDVDTRILTVDWTGSHIASVDVYEDGVLIAQKLTADSLVKSVNLAEFSKHTYRVVPYNKNNEPGVEKSVVLEVDSYVARIEGLDADYNEKTRLLTLEWDSVHTVYAEIAINDVVVNDMFTGNKYVLSCALQPGASYTVSVLPYNQRNEEGESAEALVTFGEFEIPDEPSLSVVSAPAKDEFDQYTGFSKPAVQLRWYAQKQASYEVYRATDDRKSGYIWIATVKAENDGRITYVDDRCGIGTSYYKIRQKIVKDKYISQEMSSGLSEPKAITVSVPKATVKAQLGDNGIVLSMNAQKDFVSGYEIHRKGKDGKFKKIAFAAEEEYVDEEVVFGETYYYKVKPYYYEVHTGKVYKGSYSNVTKVKNSIGGIKLSAVCISSDTVKITWTPVSNAQGYEVYYKSGTSGDSYVLWKKTAKQTLTRKLKKSGTFYFMVKAYRTTEKGKMYFSSAEVSCKMGFSAPKGLTVKKTAYQNDKKTKALIQKDTLSWNRVYGAKGYYIDVYNDVTKKYKRVGKVNKGSQTTYTVSNVVAAGAKPITYRVSSYVGGTVKNGQTVKITPHLGTPKSVTVKKSGSGVKISWKKVTGADSYEVYRSNGRTMVLIGQTTKTSVADDGLSVGVSYQYYVRTTNAVLKLRSQTSDPVSFKRLPAKVKNLKAANIKGKSVQLSWDLLDDTDGYIIYYRDSSSKTYQKLAELSSKKNVYVHKKRKIGELCRYKVVALQKNCGGILAESNAVSAKVLIEK